MSGPTAHALFSASGAPAWMKCAPKLAAERGMPDSSSAFADEGTAAHTLASWVLDGYDQKTRTCRRAAAFWIGTGIKAGERQFVVDTGMAEHVQTYADNVLARIEAFYLRGAVSVELLVEVRVDYTEAVGQPNSFGTSDVVLLIEWLDDVWQIDVDDLKFGMGVKVYAERNEQLMLYALGAYHQFRAIVGTVNVVSMAIHQPRIGHLDEWECSFEELIAFGEQARAAAQQAAEWIDLGADRIPLSVYRPGPKQCQWCKVKGTCRALAQQVFETMNADFDDLTALPTEVAPRAAAVAEVINVGAAAVKEADRVHLDALYPNLDLVEDWVKGVRAAIEHRALAGEVFENCKVVQGKRGDRAWTSAEEAEAALKSMRLKMEQMYTFKLITPTAAEKLAPKPPKKLKKGEVAVPAPKTVLGAKQWNRLQELITRADGKPSVAPISDPRPALVITPAGDDFDEVDANEDLA